jgi:hypothetical protein
MKRLIITIALLIVESNLLFAQETKMLVLVWFLLKMNSKKLAYSTLTALTI